MSSGSSTLPNQRRRSYGGALKAVSCVAVFGGVFSNFPQDLTVTQMSWPLRGSVIDDQPTNSSRPQLDFFVAGFPKCGTTTLLRTFEMHNETIVPHKEECSIQNVADDQTAYNNLMSALTNDTNAVKRGIKCPFGLSTPTAVKRLEEWFPNAKIVFGLRHPVHYFQSFYNYRVLMVHQGKLEGPIPSPESLIGSRNWTRVSTDSARYQDVLKNLHKTNDTNTTTPFSVFLYTLEQMEDDNPERLKALRETLQSFLGLKYPIEPLDATNIGKSGFNETMDICDSKHNAIRNLLVKSGMETQRWIIEKFLPSPDVTVANQEHFVELVKKWGTDPCDLTGSDH